MNKRTRPRIEVRVAVRLRWRQIHRKSVPSLLPISLCTCESRPQGVPIHSRSIPITSSSFSGKEKRKRTILVREIAILDEAGASHCPFRSLCRFRRSSSFCSSPRERKEHCSQILFSRQSERPPSSRCHSLQSMEGLPRASMNSIRNECISLFFGAASPDPDLWP